MRARSTSEVASRDEALVLLGLREPADAVALKAAFRAAVKAARGEGPSLPLPDARDPTNPKTGTTTG